MPLIPHLHPDILFAALESSSNHIVITDVNGKIIYANKAVSTITGYLPEEILGSTPRLWGGLMDQAFYEQFWDTIKNKKKPFYGEITNRRKSGELYTAVSRVSPILDEQQQLLGFIGTEEDISGRKAYEQTLEQRTQELTETKGQIEQEKVRYQALLNSIGDGVVACDQTGTAIFANTAATNILGTPSAELIGSIWAVDEPKVVNEQGEMIPLPELAHVQARQTGRIAHARYYYLTTAGKKIPVAVTASPIALDGLYLGTIIVFRDVTSDMLIDKAKTEFVSLASHQLRTPLSAINWYTEMLLAGDAGAVNPEQLQYLQEVANANTRMIQLVNDLLNVSRIELGTFVAHPQPLDILVVLRSIMDELKPAIDEKQLTLQETHDPELHTNADPTLLRAIIQNIISNAVKYTPPNGTITVSITRPAADTPIAGVTVPAHSFLLSVTDTGYGIPAHQTDKIFTKLFRADNVQEKDTEGTGLGLYIAKSICQAAGGDIWFTSTENTGSTFYFYLPPTGMKEKSGTKPLSF